jgi:hypothetical protein
MTPGFKRRRFEVNFGSSSMVEIPTREEFRFEEPRMPNVF